MRDAPWATDIAKSGHAAASACKNETRVAPTVAFCIAGSARTFATPVVTTHLHNNLIVALTGDVARARLFLHLKLNDSEKMMGLAGQRFHSHKETSFLSIMAALKLPWMSAHVGELVLLNGSGSYAGPGCTAVTDDGSCIVQPSAVAWKRYRTRACSLAQRQLRNLSGDTSPMPCCTPQNHFIATGNNEERLLLSHLGIGWCGARIPLYEEAHAMRFDMVVYTRPDAVWWQPVVPWCKWRWWDEMIHCDGPGCDMAWMVPRTHFDRLSRQHVMHRDCPARPNTRGRHVCCTTSEHLLSFARTHQNATHVLPPGQHLRPSSASGKTLKNINALRSVKGVCEIVLHPVLSAKHGGKPSNAAGVFAFRHEHNSGITVQTIVRLRRLFVRNESATLEADLLDQIRTCRSAISFYLPSDDPEDPALPQADAFKDTEWAEWASHRLNPAPAKASKLLKEPRTQSSPPHKKARSTAQATLGGDDFVLIKNVSHKPG